MVAESLAQAKNLWQMRESIPLAQAEEGLNIKHDISVPTSRIPAFVQAPVGQDATEFLRTWEPQVNRIVFDSVMAHGGSISA